MSNKDFIQTIYSSPRTVFNFNDISMLLNESDSVRLKSMINYYVQCNVLKNIRRGIYVKENYNIEELPGCIYSPSYISLEYVLRKEGVIFQYGSQITNISHLSRTIKTDNIELAFRKARDNILYDRTAVYILDNGVNYASVERAFLDSLYLNRQCYFDNTEALDTRLIGKLLPLYQSKSLYRKVKRIFR